MNDSHPMEQAFVAFLETRTSDRGTMADLRHGFSEGTQYRSWPHLAPWVDLADDRLRAAAVTVAAGFALHGRSIPGGNLGTVCRKLATAGALGERGLATFDGRFRRILACSSTEELAGHVQGVLRAAERRGIGVDFVRLFADLRSWTWRERTRLEWAQEYWGPPREDQQAGSHEQVVEQSQPEEGGAE